MELSLPNLKFKNSFIKAHKELKLEGGAEGLNLDKLEKDFDSYVQLLLNFSKGVSLPEGYVPCTEFWIIEDNEYVGRIALRHCLNPLLEKRGGHIGYEIRPTARLKGYGKKALSLVLPIAKKMNLTEVLITCDDDNQGSIKIIESNQGKLIDTISVDGFTALTRRYRIFL